MFEYVLFMPVTSDFILDIFKLPPKYHFFNGALLKLQKVNFYANKKYIIWLSEVKRLNIY